MLVTLMRKKNLSKLILSDDNPKDEWLYCNNFEKLLKIERIDNSWVIKSNKDIKIMRRK